MKPYSLSRCKKILLTLILALVAMVFIGCNRAPKFEDAYTVITSATLQAGDVIPLPQQEVTLMVTGKIGITNTQDAILMDIATIERVGLIEYEIDDLFANRPILFQGVLMRDLLELWQVDAEAKNAHFVALNDYVVDIPLDEFRDYPVMFALKADGEYMQPVERGPAMIVYPTTQYEFDLALIQWNWIWQIKSIDIQ
ncbi:MAG: molybdopterin-dependent oxidoreductase [Caldilineaceae bacterium]|nr:molybdopterin-dependent oxidoreductase [Caldilineaceae bacterium]